MDRSGFGESALMQTDVCARTGRSALPDHQAPCVGAGIAVGLGHAGWLVYATARSSAAGLTGHLPGTVEAAADAVTAAGGLGVAVACDHR